MTDRHLRMLRLMTHQRQRELHNYKAVDHGGEAVSTDRRQHLEQAATRTSARVTDAQARRRRRQKQVSLRCETRARSPERCPQPALPSSRPGAVLL
jgi:hypothetical protein